MTGMRKGDKEIWFAEKWRKCVEREGKIRSMARYEEVHIHLHLCFWQKTEWYL